MRYDTTPRLANWGGALFLVLVLPPSNKIPSKQPAISSARRMKTLTSNGAVQ